MGTALSPNCFVSFKNNYQKTRSRFSYPHQSDQIFSSHMLVKYRLKMAYYGRICALSDSNEEKMAANEKAQEPSAILTRRSALTAGFSLVCAVLSFPADGLAVKQGLLAGRIPGLSDPDEKGWRTYRRPDDKSGGHGVGWSPIIPYSFNVPQGWEEVPVSIADLGGTEIDLRFANSKEGRLFVIVAPVLRFADLGEDAKIEDIGPPDKVINAFGPEVIGENVEGKVLSMEVAEHSGRTYYQFELEPPHCVITATAAGNRLYLFNVTASGLQWKRHYKNLKQIADSFRVV
ncbi:psbP domain-containing protein 4, chloroplastic [Aristolochia californica]|uniref:psbP domain-containing protein 4, chloroplastic n=1 Tax=Aristolochia californica TaxID=171875 RepID=UPI0035E30B9D